jgi:hypothetical protein
MTKISQLRRDKQVSAQSQLQGGLNIHTTIKDVKQEYNMNFLFSGSTRQLIPAHMNQNSKTNRVGRGMLQG